MSINKKTEVDKIEVVTEFSILQVRERVRIVEDGVTISETAHRFCIVPGQEYHGTDDRVEKMVSALHTRQVIDSYRNHVAAQHERE